MRLAALCVMCVGLGCSSSGPALRGDGSPGAQEWPEKALEVMRILRLRPGDSSAVVLDANQSSQSPVTLTEGPVESYLDEVLGYLPREPGCTAGSGPVAPK